MSQFLINLNSAYEIRGNLEWILDNQGVDNPFEVADDSLGLVHLVYGRQSWRSALWLS
jgi:hypothetical protein